MFASDNPFTPMFGKIPPRMAGRDMLVSELLYALDSRPGNPEQTSLLVGARGTGKTALLALLANEAESRGWIAASTTSIPGMLEDIREQVQMRASHLLDEGAGRKIPGLSAGGFGVQLSEPEKRETNWRTAMTLMLERLAAVDTGILIGVDEVDPALPEMTQLVAAYQHFIMEDRKVALFMAGLPHKMAQLVNGESVSFLRRAARKELGRIGDADVADAFAATVRGAGKAIADESVAHAVCAIAGFPYMMQLVGYRSWAQSGNADVIDLPDIRRGIELASADMKKRVLRATLDELSPGDLDFLRAMLDDGQKSRIDDIALRLGKSASHASVYRRRLLDRGVIENKGRGAFAYALPLLRDYLPGYIDGML